MVEPGGDALHEQVADLVGLRVHHAERLAVGAVGRRVVARREVRQGPQAIGLRRAEGVRVDLGRLQPGHRLDGTAFRDRQAHRAQDGERLRVRGVFRCVQQGADVDVGQYAAVPERGEPDRGVPVRAQVQWTHLGLLPGTPPLLVVGQQVVQDPHARLGVAALVERQGQPQPDARYRHPRLSDGAGPFQRAGRVAVETRVRVRDREVVPGALGLGVGQLHGGQRPVALDQVHHAAFQRTVHERDVRGVRVQQAVPHRVGHDAGRLERRVEGGRELLAPALVQQDRQAQGQRVGALDRVVGGVDRPVDQCERVLVAPVVQQVPDLAQIVGQAVGPLRPGRHRFRPLSPADS